MLLAQFLGVLQGVPTALVTVLAGVIRNFLNVLVALKDQKGEGEPAEGEAAASEMPRRRARRLQPRAQAADVAEAPVEDPA